ncbi:MAG: hypothetical protein KIT56_01620 [Gammaproteobacteria bacterium]|nr:hypothetical protein [Gammaproteobacteria bacterium]MCW5582582.1 hypothetical protein [Gammaproteobacteria bacterium]
MQRKIIIKGGNKPKVGNEFTCLDVFHLYDKARPRKDLDNSILVESPAQPQSNMLDGVASTAINTAVGVAAQGIAGARGGAAAITATTLAQLTRNGFRAASHYVSGDPMEDLTIHGLNFPNKDFVFPENKNIEKALIEIEKLKTAYRKICNYIELKKNRDILYFLNLRNFNDQVVSDPKFMAAILLAHKIESIFSSKSSEEATQGWQHFKEVIDQFCVCEPLKQTNSTDGVFLSFQSVLQDIKSDLFSTGFQPNNTKKDLADLRELIKKVKESFIKECSPLLVGDFFPKELGIDVTSFNQKIKNINEAVQKLDSDSAGLDLYQYKQHINSIKKALLEFQSGKNQLLKKINDNFKCYSARTRSETLSLLCKHAELFKSQTKDLLEIEYKIFSMELSSANLSVEKAPSNGAVSSPDKALFDDGLEEDWEWVEFGSEYAKQAEEADGLFEGFVVICATDPKEQTDISTEVTQFVAIQEEKAQGERYNNRWKILKNVLDLLPNREQHKQEITQLTQQLQTMRDEKTALETECSTLKKTNEQQLQLCVEERKTHEKNVLLLTEQLKSKAKEQRKQSIVLNFNNWINNYIANSSSYGLFSKHRHGREGIQRATELLKKFHDYVKEKDEITAKKFKQFVQENKKMLKGNVFTHSLKTYLLTFMYQLPQKKGYDISILPMANNSSGNYGSTHTKKLTHQDLIKKICEEHQTLDAAFNALFSIESKQKKNTNFPSDDQIRYLSLR